MNTAQIEVVNAFKETIPSTIDDVIRFGETQARFEKGATPDIRKFIVAYESGRLRFAVGDVATGIIQNEQYHRDIAKRLGDCEVIGGGRVAVYRTERERKTLLRKISAKWEVASRSSLGGATGAGGVILFSKSGDFGYEPSAAFETLAPAILEAYNSTRVVRI